MSQAMRKLAGVLNKSGCSAIFINQLREKIGIVFGNPETTTGGRALKFYSSVRLEIRRGDLIKEGEINIGQEVRVKVVKNKVAPPYTTCTFDLMYGKGVSHVSGVLSLALQKNIVAKSGSWYSFDDNKIGQGQENAKKFLLENPETLNTVERKVREAFGLRLASTDQNGKQK